MSKKGAVVVVSKHEAMSQIRLLQGQEPSELQKGKLFDHMFIVAEA